MKARALIATLLVFAAIGCRSADWTLSSPAETNLHAALEALGRFTELQALHTHLPEKIRERGQQGYIFERAMDRLGDSLLSTIPTVGETELSAKLITLAADRKLRPEVYKEIDDLYINAHEQKQAQKYHRAILAPVVKAGHATEKYRLAWEYFLLRPPVREVIGLYDLRAIEALAAITSEQSLLTLTEHFRTYTSPRASREDNQKRALLAVAQFQSDKGIDALLKAISIDEAIPRPREKGYERLNVEDYIEEMLTFPNSADVRRKWKLAIQDYSAGARPLSSRQQALLLKLTHKL